MEGDNTTDTVTTRDSTPGAHEVSTDQTALKSAYHEAADRVEASISSANPTHLSAEAPENPKTFFAGLSVGLVTPAGGQEVSTGLFMNSRGSVGDYLSQGPALGYLAAASACVVAGRSDAFEGKSLSTSLGLGPLSISTSFDPATGAMIGESVSVCLAAGDVRASVSSTETYTSEFSAPQRIYREILDFIGYPAAGSASNGVF
ncbi:hypothetical protein J2797_006239 [Paraburkholderia terricola]|nr:hypothetical protein [Paraburkholderia terricola]